MTEAEGMKVIENQVAIQAASAVMMALWDAEAGPWLTTMASHRQPQRNRHSKPVLSKATFNWATKGTHEECMNFEMELINILETKVYKLTEEEKVPVIKHWLSWEDLQLIQTFTNKEKRKMQNYEEILCSIL